MTTFEQDEYSFELANDSIMTRTMDGVINFWNHGAEELYGWRKEEAIGKVSHSLLQTQFPKPLKEIESELVRTGRWEGKLVHTTRDGGRVAVESRWSLNLGGQPGAVVEINARSTDYEMDPEGVVSGRQGPLPTNKLVKVDDFLAKVANIVLVGGGIFCLILLLEVFYYYAWTRERQFASAIGIVAYCVFPTILAILCFTVLFLRSAYKINVVLFCLSISIPVYGVEAFLTFSMVFPHGPIFGSQIKTQRQKDAVVQLAKQFGVNFDTRSKLEVINDLRNLGIDAVSASPPSYLLKEQKDGTLRSAIQIDGSEVLPLAGISKKITVLCNETGNYVTYVSDGHGFHNPPGTWDLGSLDIAAVGDSYAHGSCVPSDRNFMALIRNRYSRTLNLGISGNGPLLELAVVKEYLPHFRPKAVLWFYYEENDLRDLKRETKSPLLWSYTKPDFNQDLLARQGDIDKSLEQFIENERLLQMEKAKTAQQEDRIVSAQALRNILKLSTLRGKLGIVYGRGISDNEVAATVDIAELDLLGEILSQAKASVEAWGGRLYFIYLPDWYRYGNPQLANKNREPVLRLIESLSIPIIDLHPTFEAQTDPLSLFPFRRFGHYTETGNRLVAQEVLKVISQSPGITITSN
jgi:PAS domain S-box-containing protein